MGTAKITEWDVPNGVPLKGGIDLTVDFDPQSLQLTYATFGAAGSQAAAGNAAVQNTVQQRTGTTTTLAVTLLFDTSTTGDSVQVKTEPIVQLAQPADAGSDHPRERVIRLSWGTFLFTGTIRSLSQTIDFFSEVGTPLRSTVSLGIGGIAERRAGDGGPGGGAGLGAGIGASASFGASAGIGASASAGVSAGVSLGASVGTTPLTLSMSGDSVQAIAARAGANVSWKAVAAANGIDNPRLLPPGTVLDLSAQARIG